MCQLEDRLAWLKVQSLLTLGNQPRSPLNTPPSPSRPQGEMLWPRGKRYRGRWKMGKRDGEVRVLRASDILIGPCFSFTHTCPITLPRRVFVTEFLCKRNDVTAVKM